MKTLHYYEIFKKAMTLYLLQIVLSIYRPLPNFIQRYPRIVLVRGRANLSQ